MSSLLFYFRPGLLGPDVSINGSLLFLISKKRAFFSFTCGKVIDASVACLHRDFTDCKNTVTCSIKCKKKKVPGCQVPTKHQLCKCHSIKLSNYCLCSQAGANPRQIRQLNSDMQLRKAGSEPHSLQGSECKHLTKVPRSFPTGWLHNTACWSQLLHSLSCRCHCWGLLWSKSRSWSRLS